MRRCIHLAELSREGCPLTSITAASHVGALSRGGPGRTVTQQRQAAPDNWEKSPRNTLRRARLGAAPRIAKSETAAAR